MAKIAIYTQDQLTEMGWNIEITSNMAMFDGKVSLSYQYGTDIEEYEYTVQGVDTEIGASEQLCNWASAIEYGIEARNWKPGEMYFPLSELYQWLSPQQIKQFTDMYPDTIRISYESALGLVYSQIGELFDIPAILAGEHETEGTRSVFRWMLCVLTAYNIAAPSAKRSQALEDNFQLVINKLTEMKNGASTMANAPIKKPGNAFPTIVNKSWKMLG